MPFKKIKAPCTHPHSHPHTHCPVVRPCIFEFDRRPLGYTKTTFFQRCKPARGITSHASKMWASNPTIGAASTSEVCGDSGSAKQSAWLYVGSNLIFKSDRFYPCVTHTLLCALSYIIGHQTGGLNDPPFHNCSAAQIPLFALLPFAYLTPSSHVCTQTLTQCTQAAYYYVGH
jgi:hypothetical protein